MTPDIFGLLGAHRHVLDHDIQEAEMRGRDPLGEIPEAWEVIRKLYEDLRTVLQRYLRGLGMDGDAEDVIQETFLRLLSEYQRGSRIGNAQAWVFQVAYNLSMDKYRASRKTCFAFGDEFDPAQEEADGRSNPEWLCLQRERVRRVRKGFSQLTPRQFRSVQLRVRGFRYRDIAADLQVSEQRAMILVKRALVRLDRGA